MKKKHIISILFIVILLISMFITDYNLAKKQKTPIFSIPISVLKDGGTTTYLGFGYNIIDYNEMIGRKDVVFSSKFFNIDKKNELDIEELEFINRNFSYFIFEDKLFVNAKNIEEINKLNLVPNLQTKSIVHIKNNTKPNNEIKHEVYHPKEQKEYETLLVGENEKYIPYVIYEDFKKLIVNVDAEFLGKITRDTNFENPVLLWKKVKVKEANKYMDEFHKTDFPQLSPNEEVILYKAIVYNREDADIGRVERGVVYTISSAKDNAVLFYSIKAIK